MSGGQMMVVLIVAVVMIAGIMKSRYRADGFDGRMGARNAADDGETRKMREEIRTLRERIQVLERVITDGNRSTELEREIDKLRDNDRL